MEREQFYVTTPIYYVTAKPHLGSLYSTLVADVIARWQRLQGKEVMFVTGTDEHGQKVALAAEKEGKKPQLFVDEFIPAFKKVWDAYNITNTIFVRTTDKAHVTGAQEFIRLLLDNNTIYSSLYEGWYCTPCETFVTEKELGSQGPLCPSCQRETSYLTEQAYFFRLSSYQESLLQFFNDNPDFIMPRERAQEVISFVQGGLKDLCISRSTVAWGVPFPDDTEYTIYVWVEALCNYITAIGYPTDPERFATWWPADIHVLGKDIIRFHGVYWPALLMAAGLPLPTQLLVHGWIKVDNKKMSKSLGNVIDPMVLHATYGVDAVRYYLIRHMAINQDGEFSIVDLEQRLTAELAHDLGNLVQRMTSLALNNNPDQFSSIYEVSTPHLWTSNALQLRSDLWNMLTEFKIHMSDCMFHLALAKVWHFINKVNAYFHAAEPWKIKDKQSEQFKEVISATAHSLRAIGVILWPIMPHKMEELLSGIGVPFTMTHNRFEDLALDTWHHSFKLQKMPVLFTQIEPVKNKNVHIDEIKTGQAEMIDSIVFDDFTKVALVVGTIIACESVDNSEKLLKMRIDFGDKGERQILGGIKKFYTPDALIGKQGIFVFNLKSRKMAGLDSQGMMLMADAPDGTPQMATVAFPVANGTRLK